MSLYEHFSIDFAQNFNTFTLEDLILFKKNLSISDVSNLKRLTDELFDFPLSSVVNNRADFAKDYFIHDYYSIGLYYHKNPNTIDGLPYISKDGIINKESFIPCKEGLRRTSMLVFLSSLMYYFTNEVKYYNLLKTHMEYFFLNKDTYMAANLEHAQAIPGDPKYNNGRGIGIIDFGACGGYTFVLLKDLYDSKMLEPDLYNKLKEWSQELLVWLNTSNNGIQESKEPNNHGTMYTLLCVQLHYFIGDLDQYKDYYLNQINERLNKQIDFKTGRMNKELIRSRALAYSTMNIKAFLDTYKLLNIDFKNNEFLNKAINFIIPFLNNPNDLENVKIEENGKLRGCYQIKNTYLNSYKLYLKYVTKNNDLIINYDSIEDLPNKYYLK